MIIPAVPESAPASVAPSSPVRDPYRGAVLVLLGASAVGALAAFVAGFAAANPVILQSAATLVLSTGVLAGVAAAQAARARHGVRAIVTAEPAAAFEVLPPPGVPLEGVLPADPVAVDATPPPAGPPAAPPSRVLSARELFEDWISNPGALREIRVATAAATGLAILFAYGARLDPAPTTGLTAFVAAAGCLAALALAATAVRYCSGIDPAGLPEALALTQGARVVGWVAALSAVSVALQWVGATSIVGALAFLIMAINVTLAYGLYAARPRTGDAGPAFPLDIGALSVFGERLNVLGSVLDAAERQLGIDLRSTWALTVVRRSVEPLLIGLGFVAWLSTAISIVGVEEQGLVERLGVPVEGPPLSPGLHVHWPWPVDSVTRIPVARVQALTVGHEGKEENAGPEDVLWAVQHAANEYTLVLGNGRDLITVDAAVQFRIVDARAWRYHSQNPGDALRAIAHRAVMRTTVNRTLADALSENVVKTTARMRTMVQTDADALGLGVEVLGFTVGGMHPPVAVAPDYQAVVSAELGKVTAVVNAQMERNRSLPFAEAAALMGRNTALAAGAADAAKAAGDAWSFRALQSQYHAAEDEYMYRRRLETLESLLPTRHYTILDHRFQRDGGELWVTP
jgi:regulator of protease activity HflC (stomatin/prohibitin superfamily)